MEDMFGGGSSIIRGPSRRYVGHTLMAQLFTGKEGVEEKQHTMELQLACVIGSEGFIYNFTKNHWLHKFESTWTHLLHCVALFHAFLSFHLVMYHLLVLRYSTGVVVFGFPRGQKNDTFVVHG